MLLRLSILAAGLLCASACGTDELPTPDAAPETDTSDSDEGVDATEDVPPGDAEVDVTPDGPADCSTLPECDLACMPGTHNPTDRDGCVHSCRCVDDDEECSVDLCGPAPDCPAIACEDGSMAGCTGFCLRDAEGECAWEREECPGSGLQRWATCGDPVCGGHTDRGVPACTSETVGEACDGDGEQCDPGDDCNSYIVCAASDPRLEGCPISRRAFKQDIAYLTTAERAELVDDLLALPLARWRYIAAPDRVQLGFILEDVEPSPSVDSARDQVNLYGYVSMAVAAIQQQSLEIEALRSEVAALRAQLEAAER